MVGSESSNTRGGVAVGACTRGLVGAADGTAGAVAGAAVLGGEAGGAAAGAAALGVAEGAGGVGVAEGAAEGVCVEGISVCLYGHKLSHL